MKIILLLVFLLPYTSYSQIGHELIPYRKGNNWGFSNEQGKLIIDAKYDSVRFFIGELAVVKKGDLFGYINKFGKEVIKLKYSSASDFNILSNFANVTFKGRARKINARGKKVNPKSTRGIWQCVGPATLGYDLYIYKKNEKYGFIEYTCNNPTLDSCKIFHDAIYDEYRGFGDYIAGVRISNKWAVVTVDRVQLTEFEFDDIEVHPTDPNRPGGLTKIKQKDKYGFVDEKGKIVILPKE